ncbi:MAG: DNA-processing protein DprA [Candidatus Omnitrophota bacterium]
MVKFLTEPKNMAGTKINEKECLILLNLVYGLGPVKIKNLIAYFGSPSAVFEAGEKDLLSVESLKPVDARNIVSFKKENLYRELELINKNKIKILTMLDLTYPPLLKQTYSFPPVLYVKGEISELSRPGIAIVGSRRASVYGMQTAERLSFQLSGLGINIISGMARGIDTSAHRGALKNKGKTIAVLGSGLNNIYPRENEKLFDQISASGAVVSEFPIQAAPERENFPRRNRIISGLSLGVVVVEAALKSGALITANFAVGQNREVFAIPGNISSHTSLGTNALIKEGAKLVSDVSDIVSEIKSLVISNHAERQEQEISLNSPEKIKIFELLKKDEPKHIDALIYQSKFEAQRVATVLSMLEIEGYVRQLAGKRFVKTV